MGFKFNPFSGNFDQTGSGGGGASYLDGEVATYADLPLDGTAAINSAWLVREASGTWLLGRKPAGIYIRTATAGVSRDADYTYAGILPDVFSDANFTLYDDADSTKNAKFQLSGITTGTTRTLTVPNNSGTITLNSDLAAIATSGSASDLTTGTVATARLGTGTANSTSFLRGDQTWAAVSGVTTGSVDNAVLRANGTGGSTSQSSDINIDDATTSTQANVAIVNNHSETNSALVLTPKGTGAFIVGPKPDGTASGGGNARGADAVCIQPSGRSAATQVASGAQSVAIGYRSTASGSGSVAIRGAATGSNSVSINSPTSSAAESFAVGPNASASGNYSVALGRGSASGQGAIAIGDSAAASATSSLAIGGFSARATGQLSVAFGERTLSDRFGMMALAANRFSSDGDAQWAKFVLRCKTTTNAAVEMALNGSTTYLTIPSGKVIFCNIKVVGVKSDGSVVATYERQYAAKNVAGTSSEVYAAVTIGTDNAASTSLEIATIDAGDYIRIRPTGIASETWRWVASVDAVEVAYGS